MESKEEKEAYERYVLILRILNEVLVGTENEKVFPPENIGEFATTLTMYFYERRK